MLKKQVWDIRIEIKATIITSKKLSLLKLKSFNGIIDHHFTGIT